MVALRKFRYKNCKANAESCVTADASHYEKNSTPDLTESELHSNLGDREAGSTPKEDWPTFQNYLDDLEEIEPQKIVANPNVLPEEIWTVRYTTKHDEWKYWDIVRYTHLTVRR